jgi:NAD(P)-dependent dehydrogenase (short-subunit alcohol dehydrogenase family)
VVVMGPAAGNGGSGDSRPLVGRVALITGASRGVGHALAVAFGMAGAAVACAARSAERLEATAAAIRRAGGSAEPFALDVTSTDSVAACVTATEAALGPIDILVNNAGTVLEKRTADVTDQEWDHVLETNLTSMFRCARAVAPSMIARGHGKIVNIGSMWGRAGVARYTAYCVTKAGVEALTRCLAVEWARHGIRVNCLAPGYVDTDFNRETFADDKLRTTILSKIPLRRIARVDEMGPLAVYLASPASDFMTGQTVYLDGGQTIAG